MKKSRLFSILLALTMIAVFMPVMVSADNDNVHYWYDTERDILPGWGGNIDNHVDCEHNGQYYSGEVTRAELIKGADLIEWWDLDDEHYTNFRIRDLDQNPYGKAVFKIYFRDYDGSENSYEHTVNITKHVYDIWLEDQPGKSEGLPGEEFDIYANVNHDYIDDNNVYQYTNDGLTFTWEISDGGDYASLASDPQGPNHAILRFKNSDDIGSLYYRGINQHVSVKVTAYDGNKKVDENNIGFNYVDNYKSLYPYRLPELEPGETYKFSPEIRLYTMYPDDEGFTAEDKTRGYKLIPVDDLEYNYNNSDLAVADDNGELTVTRLTNNGTSLDLMASFDNGDNRRNNYWISFRNYNIDTEGSAETNNGHDIEFFSDTQVIPSGVFNIEDLGDDPLSRFDIKYTVGNWNDGSDEGTWTKEYTDQDYAVTYNNKRAYVQLKEDIVRQMDEWDDIRVRIEVFIKGTENRVSERDLWFHIRPAKKEYDLPGDRDMLPEWDEWVDKRFHVYIENTDHPDGYNDELEASDLKILSQDPATAGKDVIEIEKENDGWRYRAKNYGSAVLQLTYRDVGGTEKTHDFIVKVKDTIYNVDLRSESGQWMGLPGASFSFTANAYKEFIQVDENDPENWWHESTQDNLRYNWDITQGGDYATVTADPADPSKATVTFKPIPDGWDSIGERVIVRVTVDDGDAKNVVSREEDLYVEDDFYQIWPATLDSDINIGESVSFTPKLRHYNLSSTNNNKYSVVSGVTFDVENVDTDAIRVTESNGKFTVKRLRDWGTDFQIIARFRENGEDRWEDTWYHLDNRDYNIWFDEGEYDIYNARTIYITRSDDLKSYGKYSISFEIECHNGSTDRWVEIPKSAYSYDADRCAITVYASKLNSNYDYGDIHAILKATGADERDTWCHFNLMKEKCPDHVMKTESKKATKTQTGFTRKYCDHCGEENYTFLKMLSSTTVTTSVKTVKYSKVKKSKQTVAPLTVKKAAGKVTYTGKGTTAKAKKALSISKTTGKITVKKGTAKGTYKMKVTVKDAGTSKVKAASITKTVTIKVK